VSSQIVAVRCSVCSVLLTANMRVHKEESSKITTQATGVTSWRRADVKYKKNEAFVDVVETVNLSMSAKGSSPKHVLATEDATIPQAQFYGLTLMVTFKCARTCLAPQSASSASMTSS
jgi:hypothetical protein